MPAQDRFGIRDLAAPYYSGSPSFLRAPWLEPDAVPPGDVAVVGMPWDLYSSSAGISGTRWGPRSIRQESLAVSAYYGIQRDSGLLNVVTGDVHAWPKRLPMGDTGDVPIHPIDVEAQIDAAVRHTAAASRTSSTTVILGGDHFVAYPAALGVITGWRERKPDLRVGYLHLDSHTDFVDEHNFTGRYSHGTCVRRISEVPEVKRIAWFGINWIAQPDQFARMRELGYKVWTSTRIQRIGVEEAMTEALDYVLDGVDILYVSFDIDTVNSADAPATGDSVFHGLTAAQALDAMRHIASASVPLAGFEVSEVNPEFDRSRRTEALAVNVILSVVGDRLFDVVDRVPADELHEVFLP